MTPVAASEWPGDHWGNFAFDAQAPHSYVEAKANHSPLKQQDSRGEKVPSPLARPQSDDVAHGAQGSGPALSAGSIDLDTHSKQH